MTGGMEQFHQTFFEESFEGLDVMEATLLNLDVGAADSEAINTIFRAAHSIKGGSATFGFAAIAEFTHLMETLLDEMRDGRRTVTQTAVDLLLRSVDALRELVRAAQEGGAADMEGIAALQGELQAELGQQPAASAAGAPRRAATGAGWRIRFRPSRDILCTGNDPLRILRELAASASWACAPI